MLADWREIIRAVNIASNLEEALSVLVGRVKESLPVDAFAVYLTGAEAG
jgi:signal transduction protein with GAF and PtsI domain